MEYLNFSRYNVDIIKTSDECVCVYCLMRFTPGEIVEWTDNKMTAICPHCGVDSVISKNSYEYTEEDLRRWHQFGFEKNEM